MCSLIRCQKAHRRPSIVEICTNQTWHGQAERHHADHSAKSSTVPHRRPLKPYKPQRSTAMLLRWFPLPSRCRLSASSVMISPVPRPDPLLLIAGAILYVLAVMLLLHTFRDWLTLHFSPPENRLLGNMEERRRAYGSVWRSFWKDRRNWVSIFMCVLVYGCIKLGCIKACALTAGGQWSHVGFAMAVIVIMVCPLLASALLFLWHRKRMSMYLRKYLNENGVPICMPCGYDLRGQVDLYCPECGTPFVRNSENA